MTNFALIPAPFYRGGAEDAETTAEVRGVSAKQSCRIFVSQQDSLRVFASDLCVFARNPLFGCGSAALSLGPLRLAVKGRRRRLTDLGL